MGLKSYFTKSKEEKAFKNILKKEKKKIERQERMRYEKERQRILTNKRLRRIKESRPLYISGNTQRMVSRPITQRKSKRIVLERATPVYDPVTKFNDDIRFLKQL